MVVEKKHIDDIRRSFASMQSREDLLNLLNQAKPLVYGNKTFPFELKQLTWYSNPKLCRDRYTEFTIKKKSGALRKIHAPVEGLKAIQKTLAFILQCVFDPHPASMGFAVGKSIVDNARLHEGSKYVYNVDLKDFFPSIDQARVWKCFQLKPFNLVDSHLNAEEENHQKIKSGIRKFVTEHKEIIYYKIDDNILTLVIDKKGNYKRYRDRLTGHLTKPGIDTADSEDLTALRRLSEFKKQADHVVFEDAKRYILTEENVSKLTKLLTSRLALANLIASLCCTEIRVERLNEQGEWISVNRNVLPQGAPTSPVITNIVCQRLDHLLSGVAKRFGLKYSRYADDITFSSMHNVYQNDSDFIKELHRIISEQGFHIKESKTRLQKEGYRQEVTGLLVNEKANVQKRYVKQLRLWLYYWERYGYDRAYSFFLQQYKSDKGHVKKGKPDMASVISGKLDYFKMVKGAKNELYIKLRNRFLTLTSSNLEQMIVSEDANTVPELTEETNISNPSEEQNKNAENNKKQKDLFPHNPLYTVSFLKKFKIGDGSGFKELVHDVILSDETIKDILAKVKSHPNFVYHFKKEWISDVSFLNRAIQKEVIKLIDLFEREGVPFYKNTLRHPFNNDSRYTSYATQFKKKYRYGSGSEYSKLQNDIINIFKDQRVPVSSLSFMPDERKFNIRSSFFTWQPSIYNGIRYLVQGISDHSNIQGERPYNLTDKHVSVEVERINADSLTFVELRILDSMSLVNVDSLTLLHFLQGSSPFKFDFRNLCDWIVECDFLDESSKRLNLLVAPEYSESLPEMVDLTLPVGGFKHILRFYDFR